MSHLLKSITGLVQAYLGLIRLSKWTLEELIWISLRTGSDLGPVLVDQTQHACCPLFFGLLRLLRLGWAL